ncbi:TonB-dependent receptor [Fulvivirga ligni]|nr:TonB-dependent receptor [Fulvivirga ligni]UII20376.1 TonB-dependent receptor [Fulvivirga ligni]
MNHLYLTMIMLFAGTTCLAQNFISGSVSANDDTPLVSANVLLYQKSDSSFIQGDVTSEDGSFRMQLPSTNEPLTLVITFIGYNPYSQDVNPNRSANLGKLVLSENTALLADVEVSARKPLLEQKIDRTIVNIENNATTAGGNVLEVLGQLPSVIVNQTLNEISMMGKQGVSIMVNDRLIRLQETDLLNYLQNLPAENVSSIELITSPPAGYDAQGNAGIINIKTKQAEAEGVTGSITSHLAYGDRGKYGVSALINLKKKKVAAYWNLSTDFNHSLAKGYLYTDYTFDDTRIVSNMDVLRKPYMGLYGLETGVDYNLSPKTSIGSVINFNSTDWKMNAKSSTDMRGNPDNLVYEMSENYEENLSFRTLLNAHINHQLTEKSSFKIDYDYVFFTRKNPTTYNLFHTYADGSSKQKKTRSNSETPLSIHVVKGDFTSRLDKIKIEAGMKAAFSSFENDVHVSEIKEGTVLEDPDYTDFYAMNENILAAYTSVNWPIVEKLTLQAGLRFEHYSMELSSLKQGNIIDRQASNLFPSAYLDYRLNDDNDWQLSYVRRIDRPGFLNLAPYFYFFNSSSLFTGNSNLIPAFTNQISLNYRHKLLHLIFQYAHTNLPIFEVHPDKDQERNIAIFRPKQGKLRETYSITLNYPLYINKWWEMNFNTAGYRLIQVPIFETKEITFKHYSASLSVSQNFKLPKNFSVDLSGNFYTTTYQGLTITPSLWDLNLGIRKEFTAGSILSLSVYDLLDTGSRWPIHTEDVLPNTYYNFELDIEGPVVRLTLTIPFGTDQIKKNTNRKTGSEEELNRLN